MLASHDSLLSVAIRDVTATLNLRRPDYVDTHHQLLKKLSEFKDRLPYRHLIYRVYSRADKQVGGNLLKDDVKIAEKLARWRKDKPAAVCAKRP